MNFMMKCPKLAQHRRKVSDELYASGAKKSCLKRKVFWCATNPTAHSFTSDPLIMEDALSQSLEDVIASRHVAPANGGGRGGYGGRGASRGGAHAGSGPMRRAPQEQRLVAAAATASGIGPIPQEVSLIIIMWWWEFASACGSEASAFCCKVGAELPDRPCPARTAESAAASAANVDLFMIRKLA
jgi:hypothetical protein